MSHAAETYPDDLGQNEEYTSTGIPHKKLCMWAFLASNCMFFGVLISTHLIFRSTATVPLEVKRLLDIPLTAFSTFILLTSLLLMALGVSAIKKGHLKMTRWMTFGVIIFGMIFFGCQVYEFTNIVKTSGLTLSSHIFGSTFFVLIGTHVIQVALGVLWLVGWLIYSFTGKMTPVHAVDMEVAGLYWNFLVIIRVIIFPVVYLVEYIQ